MSRTVMHRGAGGIAPENTLAAVAAGSAVGPDFVEVDVQLTADDVPIVVHDTTFRRTTDVDVVFPDRADAPVGAFSYDEVRRLDAGAWFDHSFAGERVPALREILDALAPGVGVFLELKDPALSPGLVAAVATDLSADVRWDDLAAAGGVMALSFDHAAVREFHDRRPDVAIMPLGLVPHDASVLAEIATWADAWGTDYRFVEPDAVARVHAAGMVVSVYTVNNPEPVADLLDAGVDLMTSDFPQLLHWVHEAQGDTR